MRHLEPLPWTHIYILFALACVLPFIINAFFVHPAADDYVFSVNAIELGFWQAQQEWYTIWQGRYFASMLLFTNPLVYGAVWAYPVLPLLWLSGLFLAVFLLIKASGFEDMSLKQKILITLMILVIYLHRMPSTTWGLYWMAGAITYQLGNILSLLYFAFLCMAFKAKAIYRKWLLGLAAILFLVASNGCNEVIMLINTGITLLILFYQVNFLKQWNPVIIAAGVMAVFSAIIVILSPGNDIRLEEVADSGLFWPSVLASIKRSISQIWLRLFISPLLIFSLISLPYLYSLSEKFIQKGKPLFSVHPGLILVILLVAVPFLFFPLHYGQGAGDNYPQRITNVIYLFFILGWFYLMIASCVWYRKKNPQVREIKMPHGLWIVLLVLYGMFPFRENNSIRMAYSDLLTGKTFAYHQHMKARHEIFADPSVRDVVVRNMETPPLTIAYPWINLHANSSHWINRYTARYHGKEVIIAID